MEKDVLPFGDKAAAHCGQLRAELERAGTPCGPHDVQIGGHARSEGFILATNNIHELARMPGVAGGELGLSQSPTIRRRLLRDDTY